MYNLLEYSENDSMTWESLWNCYTEMKKMTLLRNLIRSTPNNDYRLDTEVAVLLKYLSNFWRSINLPLINCEIKLNLSWWRYCVISEVLKTYMAIPNTDPVRYDVATIWNSATFQINNARILFQLSLCLLMIISIF